MGGRPKHTRPELEDLIRSLERQGWRVEKGAKYYKAKCPCDDKHMTTVHCTPGMNYDRNLRAKLRRETCWEGAQR